jgi:hypothetical protein
MDDDKIHIDHFKDKLYDMLPDHIPEENRNSIVNLVFEICEVIDGNETRDIYCAIEILHNRFSYLIDNEQGGTVH